MRRTDLPEAGYSRHPRNETFRGDGRKVRGEYARGTYLQQRAGRAGQVPHPHQSLKADSRELAQSEVR